MTKESGKTSFPYMFYSLGEPTESWDPVSSHQDLEIQTEKAQVPADVNVPTCPTSGVLT